MQPGLTGILREIVLRRAASDIHFVIEIPTPTVVACFTLCAVEHDGGQLKTEYLGGHACQRVAV